MPTKRNRSTFQTNPRTPSGFRRWLLAAIERVDDIENRGDLGVPDPEPDDFYRIERLVEEAGNHAATLGWDDLFRFGREMTNGEAVSGNRFPFWALMENARSFFGKCLARCGEPRTGKESGDESLSPQAFGDRFGYDRSLIMQLIKAGILPAENTSRGALRPRYKIDPKHISIVREYLRIDPPHDGPRRTSRRPKETGRVRASELI